MTSGRKMALVSRFQGFRCQVSELSSQERLAQERIGATYRRGPARLSRNQKMKINFTTKDAKHTKFKTNIISESLRDLRELREFRKW